MKEVINKEKKEDFLFNFFGDLKSFEKGNYIYISTLGEVFNSRIDVKKVVRETYAEYLQGIDDSVVSQAEKEKYLKDMIKLFKENCTVSVLEYADYLEEQSLKYINKVESIYSLKRIIKKHLFKDILERSLSEEIQEYFIPVEEFEEKIEWKRYLEE